MRLRYDWRAVIEGTAMVARPHALDQVTDEPPRNQHRMDRMAIAVHHGQCRMEAAKLYYDAS